jgi:hypothetical protein
MIVSVVTIDDGGEDVASWTLLLLLDEFSKEDSALTSLSIALTTAVDSVRLLSAPDCDDNDNDDTDAGVVEADTTVVLLRPLLLLFFLLFFRRPPLFFDDIMTILNKSNKRIMLQRVESKVITPPSKVIE